jgi:hypothetical protein
VFPLSPKRDLNADSCRGLTGIRVHVSLPVCRTTNAAVLHLLIRLYPMRFRMGIYSSLRLSPSVFQLYLSSSLDTAKDITSPFPTFVVKGTTDTPQRTIHSRGSHTYLRNSSAFVSLDPLLYILDRTSHYSWATTDSHYISAYNGRRSTTYQGPRGS